MDDGSLLLLNGLLSGVAAGVSSAIQGHGFRRAFTYGVVGGVVAYTGKRLITSEIPGRLLVARELHAVGTSITVNSSRGRSPFEELSLPFGPLYLRIHIADHPGVSLAVSGADLARMAISLADADFKFQVRESLRAGILIFDAGNGRLAGEDLLGRSGGGLVFVETTHPVVRDLVIRHEVTHVLQSDFQRQMWFRPAERKLIALAGLAERWPAWIHPDALDPVGRGLLNRLGVREWIDRPREWEAYYLEDQVAR